MKTTVKFFTLIAFLCIGLSFSIAAVAAPLPPDFDFRNETLISGTNNQIGAKYRFPLVKPGVDAIVTITNFTNGVTLTDIDGADGFTEALQPVIVVPARKKGYVEFRIDFVIHNTIIPALQIEVPITAIDVDGNRNSGNYVKEFDQIQLLPTSLILFNGASPELNLNFAWGWVTGNNVSGIDYPGVDTTAKQVMFSAVNAAVLSVTVRVGADNEQYSSVERLRSFYFRRFTFPNSILPGSNLLSFNGSLADTKCKLEWALNEENNADIIVLERSNSGKDFSPVAEFFAKFDGISKTNFSYSDNTTSNTVYYRLKLVSASGKVEYSNVLNFRKFEAAASRIKVYPTIVEASATATIFAETTQSAQLQWTDMSGRIVHKQSVKLQKGANSLAISKPNLPGGNYILAALVDNKMQADRVVIR